MAKIKDIILSEAQNRALISLLSKIPSKNLKEFASCFNELNSITNPDELKKRLESLLLSNDCELNDEQLKLLYKYSQYRNLFNFVDANFLKEKASEFAGLIGKEMFEVMILISNKDNNLLNLPGNLTPSSGKVLEDFKEEFPRFIKNYILQPLDLQFSDSDFKKIFELNEKIANLDREISRNVQQLKEQKQRHSEELLRKDQKASEEKKALQAEINELIKINKTLSHKLDEKERECIALKNKVQELENRLFELQSNFESKIDSEVKRRFSQLITTVFPQYESIRAEANEKFRATQDIINEAEQALRIQTEYDRVYGARVELEKRLEELSDIHRRILSAIQNSINIYPNLYSVKKRVEQEIERIRSILSKDSEGVLKNDVTASLLQIISQKEDTEELNRICEIAEYFNKRGIIDKNELDEIYRRIYANYQMVIIQENLRPRETGFALVKSLSENLNSVVVLDAHNIINSDVFKCYLYSENHDKSRANLISTVKSLAENRNNVQFVVVFDGSDYRCEELKENVKVYYSGGFGEQRADNFIVEGIKAERFGSPSEKTFIITDDLKLANDLLEYGVIRVQLSLFEYILKEFRVIK